MANIITDDLFPRYSATDGENTDAPFGISNNTAGREIDDVMRSLMAETKKVVTTLTDNDTAINVELEATTAKLDALDQDEAITNAKLDSNAVTSTKIAAGAVTRTKLADDVVNEDKLDDNAVTTDKILDGSVTLAKLMEELQNSFWSVGDIKAHASNGSTLGGGWLICDGRTVLRATYPDLFAVIGSNFTGGQRLDSTEFRLPDLRGRTMVGVNGNRVGSSGRSPAITASWVRSIGGASGEQDIRLTEANLPPHRHFVANGDDRNTSSGDVLQGNEFVTFGGSSRAVDDNYQLRGSSTEPTRGRTSETGGNQAFSNIQPSIAINMFIKAF